jgi:hypothetical protein
LSNTRQPARKVDVAHAAAVIGTIGANCSLKWSATNSVENPSSS